MNETLTVPDPVVHLQQTQLLQLMRRTSKRELQMPLLKLACFEHTKCNGSCVPCDVSRNRQHKMAKPILRLSRAIQYTPRLRDLCKGVPVLDACIFRSAAENISWGVMRDDDDDYNGVCSAQLKSTTRQQEADAAPQRASPPQMLPLQAVELVGGDRLPTTQQPASLSQNNEGDIDRCRYCHD